MKDRSIHSHWNWVVFSLPFEKEESRGIKSRSLSLSVFIIIPPKLVMALDTVHNSL